MGTRFYDMEEGGEAGLTITNLKHLNSGLDLIVAGRS